MHMRNSSTPQDLIGSDEAAKLCGVDRGTFNRWATAGEISPVLSRPGRTGVRLYHRLDVERLARRKSSKAAS